MATFRDKEFSGSEQWNITASNLKATMILVKNQIVGESYTAILTELDGKTMSRRYGPASEKAIMMTLQRLTTGRLEKTRVSAPTRATIQQSEIETMLEQLRIDPKTPDKMYFAACANLKQKPKQRPDFSAPVATIPTNPYSPADQLQIFAMLFLRAINASPFTAPAGRPDLKELNRDKMLAWLRDEGYAVPDNQGGITAGNPVTAAVLIECIKDLHACRMLHDVDSGSRGMKHTVQPYSRWAILQMREGVAELRAEPTPVTITPEEAKRQIRQDAFENVRQQFPGLEPESGEFRAKMDEVISQRAQQELPGAFKKSRTYSHTAL